jgi:G3E family GTPase
VIAVNLLTGCLGAGKTTLLRRLLADPALAGCAVLVNEIGEIGLDHHLLGRIDETVVLLKSGCVCCTIRGELAQAVRDLLARRDAGTVPPFGRLVIESTGLADPFPILSTLRAEPVLSHHVAPAAVVTLVDAVNAARHMASRPECLRQIAAADRLLVSKADLVPAAEAAALMRRLAAINPAAAVRDVRDPDCTAAWLLQDAHAAGLPPGALPAHHAHDGAVASFCIVVPGALDWTRFGLWLAMLLNRHGARVLRVKAILNLTGEARPVAVHGVQHLVHPPTHLPEWPNEDRSSRLVFITDGLDERQIRRSLAALCGVQPAPGEPAASGREAAFVAS